mgnify:CR=1 FL=1|jgi:hypothetical protein
MFYKKRCKELETIVEHKRQKIDKYENKNSDLRIKNASLENKIKKLEFENGQLVDWIRKIINEVGCYEVKDDNEFRIPIYKNEETEVYYNVRKGMEWKLRKEIILPKIIINQISDK